MSGSGYIGFLGEQLTSDQIRYLIQNGQGFRLTSGKITTGAVAGAIIGLEVIWNAVAKNVFVYRAIAATAGSASDVTFVHDNSTTQDTALTANLISPTNFIANLKTGSLNASLVSAAWATPGASTATATVGNSTIYQRLSANAGIDLMQNQSGIFIPAQQAGRVIIYQALSTATNAAGDTLEWVEY